MESSFSLNDAIEALRNKDKPRARELLDAVIRQDPQNDMAWLYMALAAENRKQALACLERVTQINPENDKAWVLINRLKPQATTGQNQQQTAPITAKPQVSQSPVYEMKREPPAPEPSPAPPQHPAVAVVLNKSNAHDASPSSFWNLPYGEPAWVEILAGEFWMGSLNAYNDDEKPLHRVYLPHYAIAKAPITNAQYRFFIAACQYTPPKHWENGEVPQGKENHPVVNVSWYDAIAYCRWLSDVTRKRITLPSEAEWEKAARGPALNEVEGAKNQREYPWGDAWIEGYCNLRELGKGDTTPIGIFPAAASPYGCVDMAGNVWEWTRSLWGKVGGWPDFRYPYRVDNKRENLEAGDEFFRVLRGGCFNSDRYDVRCAFHVGGPPYYSDKFSGFRVVVSLSRA